MPRPRKMIRAGLARRIGRVGPVGAVLAEQAGGAQLAIDFVGRDLQEAKAVAPRRVEPPPVVQRPLQQDHGAEDIGLDEGRRPVDRAVDVAFRGEVIDGARMMIGEDRAHRRAVADIRLDEDMPAALGNRRKIVEIAGIGELVDGDDALAVGDEGADHGRADEAGAAGDEDGHERYSKRSGCLSADSIASA